MPQTLFSVLLVLPLNLLPTLIEASVHRLPAQSPEKIAESNERDLRATKLKIGPDCLPANFTTKIWLKTLNPEQLKHFWLGQKYAVERSSKEQIELRRIQNINKIADARINEIEAQRDAANLASMGVKPFRSIEMDRATAQVNAELARMDFYLIQTEYEWATRCLKFTTDRSR